MTSLKNTSAILLTPPGRGALATVAVEGESATALVSSRFHSASGKLLEQTPVGRILFGCWIHAPKHGEDVVVCRRSPQRIEVTCHGGHPAAQSILDSLEAAGARLMEPSAWVHSRVADPIEAAARMALTHAPTERTAAVLLDQAKGALRDKLRLLVDRLGCGRSAAAREGLDRLLELASVGRRLTAPWRVVLAGPPNAGKSTLANAILGYERSITVDQPGTTRDRVATRTVLDGWPVELTDTAGLRASSDPIESEGVARTETGLAGADLVVLIFDASLPRQPQDQQYINRLPDALIVGNKQDRAGAQIKNAPDTIPTSALTGEGLERLMGAIVERLVPAPPGAGEAVPFTEDQHQVLAAAHERLSAGDDKAAARCIGELLEGAPVGSP